MKKYQIIIVTSVIFIFSCLFIASKAQCQWGWYSPPSWSNNWGGNWWDQFYFGMGPLFYASCYSNGYGIDGLGRPYALGSPGYNPFGWNGYGIDGLGRPYASGSPGYNPFGWNGYGIDALGRPYASGSPGYNPFGWNGYGIDALGRPYASGSPGYNLYYGQNQPYYNYGYSSWF